MTRHCWQCGLEWTAVRVPGRSETCAKCQSDLRVCRNCVSFDPSVAYQCRDRRAEPVEQKELATFCEYFEFAVRAYTPPSKPNPRESKARDTLRKLFGDA